MKNILIFLSLLLGSLGKTQTYIEPMRLEVAVNKTTNLVFPSDIISIDRGSESIVVQKATTNILRVKAFIAGFEQTNLSVITTDGHLYSFLVSFASDPPELTINVGGGMTITNSLETVALAIARKPPSIYCVHDCEGKVSICLQGLYVNDTILFYKLHIENLSQIRYDIEQLRFYIRDKKQFKRTASQENELQPLFTYGNTTSIASKSAQLRVVALPKFTLPGGKYLGIEMLEKNGGRHLLIKCKDRHIMKAKSI